MDYSEYMKVSSMKTILSRVGTGLKVVDIMINCSVCNTVKVKTTTKQEHLQVNRNFCDCCQENFTLKYKNSQETCTLDEYLESILLAYELAEG